MGVYGVEVRQLSKVKQAICKLSLVITWAHSDEKNSNKRNILKVNFPLKTTNQKLVNWLTTAFTPKIDEVEGIQQTSNVFRLCSSLPLNHSES